ncbi:MAG TPA: ABC transporter ATP-binding protein [Ilumatobacteraceae bacterium]|nr:ABC transporter ATP-binding protein [Ilumatobacteraceae bacterium]
MTLAARIELRLGTLDLQIELTVEPGEIVALLGPNGAGKSTVLRCLAGLEPIDDGRILLGGTAIDDPAANVFVEPEQRPIGFVFQDYVLFAHLSVLENVAYGLRARGVAKGEARERAGQWLERMNLTEYSSERPDSLSGGQAQRVALARALATNPRLLLLDEPLAALDVGTRAIVRRDLRRHLETFEGMRLIVTHDPVDAHALADRVVVLEAGRVAQAGTLAEVTAHPRTRYVADLVGVNLVAGEVVDGVLTTASGARVVIADAADGPTLASIRPHSVLVARGEASASSARNTWAGSIVDVDRLGERVRVVIDGELPLTAEITAAALDELRLGVGDRVHASVKATDIEVAPS